MVSCGQPLSRTSSAGSYKGLSVHRFVTTLMTKSDEKAVETPYLIRSYDHNKRTSPNQSRRSTRRGTMRTDRSNTGRSGETIIGRHGNTQPQTPINYENAQDFEIWEVARAATAAPFYFEPFRIRIPRSSGHLLFTDGGFSTSNNPTREGTQEIEEMHGANSIGVVVSIGTARDNERPREKGILPIIQKLKGFVQSATDPEVMHLEMKRKSYPDKFPYYRLNDPGGTSVELDEWKPKRGMFKNKAAGSETIKVIKDAFSTWAGRMENVRILEQCAADLVDRRRARTANRTMWERYATCARFTCRFRACDVGPFSNRDDFRDHLNRHHPSMPPHQLDQEMRECRRQWHYQSV